MAYEFKKLSAVEAIESLTDSANILVEENGVIKKISKDEIGGGIKVASTATVGQTIVVKAVDESGNPTEWECADLKAGYDVVIENETMSSKVIGWNSIQSVEFSYTHGSIENIINKLQNNEKPRILFKYNCSYSSEGLYEYFEPTNIIWYRYNNGDGIRQNIYCEFFGGYGDPVAFKLALREDGTIECEPNLKFTYSIL